MELLQDNDKTTIKSLQDAVDKLRADNIILERRVSDVEYMLHNMHMHMHDSDKHLDFVEQSIKYHNY